MTLIESLDHLLEDWGQKVIGHTRSGKPVRNDSKTHHKGFTLADHADAYELHLQQHAKVAARVDREMDAKPYRYYPSLRHVQDQEMHHHHMAMYHRDRLYDEENSA